MTASLLLQAVDFAATRHRMQRRKDLEHTPYINHPVAVARLLAVEGGVTDTEILIAAVLHDVLEDTDTQPAEIEDLFGSRILGLVLEVTDDKSLPKQQRKQIQVDKAASSSESARLVKLADKICNLRDMHDTPPADWSIERRREYYDWARAVVDNLGNVHAGLQRLFDEQYAKRP